MNNFLKNICVLAKFQKKGQKSPKRGRKRFFPFSGAGETRRGQENFLVREPTLEETMVKDGWIDSMARFPKIGWTGQNFPLNF